MPNSADIHAAAAAAPSMDGATPGQVAQFPAAVAPGLRVTLEDIDHPMYLVNNNFEVEWQNPKAAEFLEQSDSLAEEITDRNVFRLFFDSGNLVQSQSWEEIVRFHFALAKNRFSKDEMKKLGMYVSREDMERLEAIYDEAQAFGRVPLYHTEVNLASRGGEDQWYDLYASVFREGIVFAYVPSGSNSDSLLAFFARRELVIRDLLKMRRPFLTPLTVLVADIQDSVKICAELPPEEYFEMINEMWGAMDALFRKYYATHGKHVGDGMVYYFFPQPDCNHLMNAVLCGHAMKETMRSVSHEWRQRKNWTNELVLNTGIDEGQEWFGTYQTPTHLEFTVLGDTINRAARLSDFARNGSVWLTKNLVGNLTPEERERVRFGIRRTSDNGEEVIVSNTYSRVSNLADLQNVDNHKFHDIATLAVTEMLDVV